MANIMNGAAVDGAVSETQPSQQPEATGCSPQEPSHTLPETTRLTGPDDDAKPEREEDSMSALSSGDAAAIAAGQDDDDDYVADDSARTSSPSASDVDARAGSDSDDDYGDGRRKASKRKPAKQRTPPPRPDNPRARSLRSAQPKPLEPTAAAAEPAGAVGGGSSLAAATASGRPSRAAAAAAAAAITATAAGTRAPAAAPAGPAPAAGRRPQLPPPRSTAAAGAPGRSSATPDNSDSETAHSSDSGGSSDSESAGQDDADIDVAALQRPAMSSLEATAYADDVWDMWEFAAVLEFLQVFKGHLCAGPGGELLAPLLGGNQWSGELLVDALVSAPGPGAGLLGKLHMGLLQGVTPRTQKLADGAWPAVLAQRISSDYKAMYPDRDPGDYYAPPPALAAAGSAQAAGQGQAGGKGRAKAAAPADPLLPFLPRRGREWQEYVQLHHRNRVLALKLLCDMRLEKEDLREAVEEAAAAAAKGGAGGSSRDAAGRAPRGQQAPTRGGRSQQQDSGPGPLDPTDVRKAPLGTDSAGCALWLLGRVPEPQLRLVREHPATWPKSRKPKPPPPPPPPKGRKKPPPGPPLYMLYQLPLPAVAGRWEVVACGAEELGGCAEEIRARSKKKQDLALADKLAGEVVPALLQEAERREKQAALEKKLRSALGADFYDTYGRSRRTRKEVDYSGQAYDKMMHAAIREGKRQRRSESPGPAPAPGRRGGLRSAHDEDAGAEAAYEDEYMEEGEAAPGKMQPDRAAGYGRRRGGGFGDLAMGRSGDETVGGDAGAAADPDGDNEQDMDQGGVGEVGMEDDGGGGVSEERSAGEGAGTEPGQEREGAEGVEAGSNERPAGQAGRAPAVRAGILPGLLQDMKRMAAAKQQVAGEGGEDLAEEL